MRRALTAAVIALGCLPDAAIEADAGLRFGDAPAARCGHPYEPCCEGARCADGWSCRAGICVAPTPRCVATGIADPLVTRDIDVESADALPCAAVPEILRREAIPGSFRGGDGIVGRLECEGMEPGEYTLRTRLRVRMTIPNADTPTRCMCPGSHWEVRMNLVLDGDEVRVVPLPTAEPQDGSCRMGPEIDWQTRVTIPSSGRLQASLELLQCKRAEFDTRCFFLNGTSVSVESM